MFYPWIYPKIPLDYNIPPTIYSILDSIVNYDNENPVSVSELAENGRNEIFDFTYPLSSHIQKEDFEVMILNHFMMRRIGSETLTSFKLALNVKLNEIMPMYNKLWDAIDGWDLFEDGEITTRVQSDSRNTTNSITSTTNGTNTSDRRYSNMPQNELSDIRDGKYITEYNYDSDNATTSSNTSGSGSDLGVVNETITRTPSDKMSYYKSFLENKQNVYTMIFKDLDSLFYQII